MRIVRRNPPRADPPTLTRLRDQTLVVTYTDPAESELFKSIQ